MNISMTVSIIYVVLVHSTYLSIHVYDQKSCFMAGIVTASCSFILQMHRCRAGSFRLPCVDLAKGDKRFTQRLL